MSSHSVKDENPFEDEKSNPRSSEAINISEADLTNHHLSVAVKDELSPLVSKNEPNPIQNKPLSHPLSSNSNSNSNSNSKSTNEKIIILSGRVIQTEIESPNTPSAPTAFGSAENVIYIKNTIALNARNMIKLNSNIRQLDKSKSG